jgi:restriction system protein
MGRRRQTSGGSFAGVLLIVVLVGLFAFVFQHAIVFLGILIVIVVFFVAILHYRRKKRKKEAVILRQSEIEAEKTRRKKILDSRINDIDAMSGQEFEQFLAVLLEEGGSSVELTPKSKDYGADLILTNEKGKRAVIQAKRYSEKTVGVDAVQQVNTAKAYYKAQDAFVITNRKFSNEAQVLVRATSVRLLDREDLIELILKYKVRPTF